MFHLHGCMSTMYAPGTCRGQKTVSNPLGLELQTASTQLRSRAIWFPAGTGRALHVCHHPSPVSVFQTPITTCWVHRMGSYLVRKGNEGLLLQLLHCTE